MTEAEPSELRRGECTDEGKQPFLSVGFQRPEKDAKLPGGRPSNFRNFDHDRWPIPGVEAQAHRCSRLKHGSAGNATAINGKVADHAHPLGIPVEGDWQLDGKALNGS